MDKLRRLENGALELLCSLDLVGIQVGDLADIFVWFGHHNLFAVLLAGLVW